MLINLLREDRLMFSCPLLSGEKRGQALLPESGTAILAGAALLLLWGHGISQDICLS